MAGKFIQAVRNKHVLVNVKWRRDSLHKHVYEIGVSVGAIVEIGVESAEPFLRLHDVMSVGRVKNESPNCTSRTPLILGLTLKVKSADVSFESVL